jgi:hypothetical protein
VQVTERPHTGVVDQHVDPPELPQHPVDQVHARGGVRDVDDLLVDPGVLVRHLAQRGLVPCNPDDGVAEPGEVQRRLPTDAGGCAGDEDNSGAGWRDNHGEPIPRCMRLNQV